MFFSSSILALVLATPDAEAMDRIVKVGRRKCAIAVRGGDVPVRSGFVDVGSDAGVETAELVESDAWLHGAAPLAALPKTDASLVFTVYDAGSAPLIRFSGALGADGSVVVTSVATDATDCATRTGCADTGAAAVDIEVLAAEVFANPAGGYDLSFDLGGADTYAAAYADVRIDERAVTTTCDKSGCTPSETVTTTTSEVAWDDIGAVWEAELTLAHAGVLDVDATLYDASGKKLDKSGMTLAAPWSDGGDGVGALATDGDPLTSVALLRVGGSDAVAVFSDGWSLGDTLPASATLELDDGETLTVPANSYQVAASTTVLQGRWDGSYAEIAVDTGGSAPLRVTSSLADLTVPVCAEGACFASTAAADGGYDLSVTAYSDAASTLPEGATVTVVLYDRSGTKLASDQVSMTFSDEVAVLFANEVRFAADPLGLHLGGQVTLLGTPDARGREKTLSSGTFSGAIVRDEDGELALGAVDRHDLQSPGDLVVVGAPIAFERADTDADGEIEAPPVILTASGEGTRAVATGTNASPGSL